MSTVEVRIKAARSLLKMRTEFDKMFPKIYILGNKTCPFINPLRRIVGDMACEIEEMNISEAFNIIYGRPIQPEEYDMVDWNINQAGALYDGQLYNPEGYVRRRTDIDGGRPEEVEFTPMDEHWQEHREGIAVDEQPTIAQAPATDEAPAESPESDDEPDVLNAQIEYDKLDARSRDTLQYAGCATYRDIIKLGREKMLTFRNYGKKSLTLLDEHLEAKGLADYWFGQIQLKTIKK